MAKKRRDEEASGLDRVFAQLDEAPLGLHDVAEPAMTLPSGLPEALIELYARCDGAHLFFDGIELAPSAEAVKTDGGWIFGSLEDEDLIVDERGRVWRNDPSLDDRVCEGTRLDRWLAGIVDAIAMLYDHDGEFAEDLFDEEGELLPAIAERQLRAQLKRDAGAPGPRWRLAHALLATDAADATLAARGELEDVVAREPSFSWAWLDLARISEALAATAAELAGALDEARAAAEAATAAEHPQAGYFWAQLARLAAKAKDEPTRAEAAQRSQQLAPDLKAAQMDGVRDSLEHDDAASAKGLMDLLRAVWPRDLEVLDLARKIDASLLGN